MREPRAELSRIARTLAPLAFPRKLAVEVCADCNLACSMCHHPMMRRPKGLMPFELFQRLADEVADVQPDTELWLSFCGEPLLAPERTTAMLGYAVGAGLQSVNLNTNGVLLDAAAAEALLETGLNLIVIGIDGFSRETYEKYRCGGDRDRVFENVEHLLARRDARGARTEVQVQFIEMAENLDERDLVVDHWLTRGAVVKVRRQLSWGGKFDAPFCAPTTERIACPWAMTMMHVFWDGRVPRCPGDTEGEEGAGNAWDESLTALWARLGPYRGLHLAQRFDDLPARCATCTDWATGAAVRVRSSDDSASLGPRAN